MLEAWKRLSRVGKLCGVIGAITGAVVGVAAAWPIVEYVVPAHRGYVVEQIGDVRVPLNELMLWRLEDSKNRARSEASDWSIKLPKESDPQTRSMIERRIDQLTAEQNQLDERIRKLKR